MPRCRTTRPQAGDVVRERHLRLLGWDLSWWRETTRWGESEVQRDTWLHLRRRRRTR